MFIKTIVEFCEDVWLWNSFDAEYKLWLSFVLGKRILGKAYELIEDTTEKLGKAPSLITADECVSYEKPVSQTFDVPFVQICKTREKGKVTDINYNLYQGTVKDAAQVIVDSKVSSMFNTAFIERFQSTLRQFCSRLKRKAYTFSKKIEKLEIFLSLYQGFYNIARPHATLRKESRKNTTPAMAAGLTDHVWSIRELLSYQF
jgi:IS1 family transposase